MQFQGFLGHATSSAALDGIAREGALLPSTRLPVAEGESLVNPTCHPFVSLEDGNHPLAADALLVRRALLEGADVRLPPYDAQVERLLAAERPAQRAVLTDAIGNCLMTPDRGRADSMARAANRLLHAVESGEWLGLAIAHLRAPPPYQLYPRAEGAIMARLLHDLLLELGFEPGAEAGGVPGATTALGAAESAFRERLTRLVTRHRAAVEASAPGETRRGVILLFSRERLVGETLPHGPRERRSGPIPARGVVEVATPQALSTKVHDLFPWTRIRVLTAGEAA